MSRRSLRVPAGTAAPGSPEVTSPPGGVAIVIPTRDRVSSVQRTLRALSAQTYPSSLCEVVVVADGCTDDTASALLGAEWPMPVRVIVQAAAGPAAARNRGAAATNGRLLIFLDDDIEPWPEFVAAHVSAHAEDGESSSVAIGYLPPDLQGRTDFFAIMLRAWWEGMFERAGEPGHRFSYSDLLSGNFSITRRLFELVGGFDESLRCHEDYELGMRLISAGARLRFVPAAAGWHHERTDLSRALQRKRDEGRADVVLARRHPFLAPVLPFSAPHRHLTRRGRLLKRLAPTRPEVGDALEACCRTMLALLERLRLRGRWRRLLDDLLAYWYWRGVAEGLGDEPLPSLRTSVPQPEPFDIDLRRGLASAMRQLDERRPESVRLRWGTWLVGTIAAHPGSEPLEGRHLPPLLRGRFAEAFEETISLQQSLGRLSVDGVNSTEDRHVLRR